MFAKCRALRFVLFVCTAVLVIGAAKPARAAYDGLTVTYRNDSGYWPGVGEPRGVWIGIRVTRTDTDTGTATVNFDIQQVGDETLGWAHIDTLDEDPAHITLPDGVFDSDWIDFYVVGEHGSDPIYGPGDIYIHSTSADSPDQEFDTYPLTVIIPWEIGNADDCIVDGDAGDVEGQNLGLGADDSPAITELGEGYVELGTYYIQWLHILVNDQYHEPLSSAYDGGEVWEADGESIDDINETLSSGYYYDPVFVWVTNSIVLEGSDDAVLWPGDDTIPMSPSSGWEYQNFDVAIDYDSDTDDGVWLNTGVVDRYVTWDMLADDICDVMVDW